MASEEVGYPKNFHKYIDKSTFEQILEMDDEEDEREFSRAIVFGFFEQAGTTFVDMNDALEAGDLQRLSSLGHFLKGSSATLGLTNVKDCCERIQNDGDRRGKEDSPAAHAQVLKVLRAEIKKLREEYKRCEDLLKEFYETD